MHWFHVVSAAADVPTKIVTGTLLVSGELHAPGPSPDFAAKDPKLHPFGCW